MGLTRYNCVVLVLSFNCAVTYYVQYSLVLGLTLFRFLHLCTLVKGVIVNGCPNLSFSSIEFTDSKSRIFN